MSIKRLLFAWVALLVGCVTSVAQTLPVATSLTSTGQIPSDAKWYTLQIAANGYLISDQGADPYITLARTSGIQDKDLWCFVGDNETGYTLYNKAKGSQFKFATPSKAAVASTPSQGLTAYSITKSIESMGDYRSTWKLVTTTNLGGSFFMHPSDDATQRINNRSGKLAYWTTNADDGSAIKILPVSTELTILPTTGTLTNTTAGSASAWKYLWTSTATNPRLTLNAGLNNMRLENGELAAYRGNSDRDYILSVPAGYVITGYSFDFIWSTHDNGSHTSIAVTAGGEQKMSSASLQSFNVKGLNAQSVTAFRLGTANSGIILRNFKVQISRVIVPTEPSFEVFLNNSAEQIPYRIPAIATAKNGNLIAVADYRYTRQDIGMGTPKGQLDIRARIFDGQNWGEVFTLAQGNNAVDGFHKAFGDPCIVADRESAKVLLLTCAGDVSFFDGTRDYHQGVARFISENNGAEGSWSHPQDITEQFYAQLDGAARGPIKAMFIGSGKIHQSRYIKKGDYYRLYVATLARDKDGVFANYVYFSDDFGVTWTLLGDKDTPAVPSGDANEPKVEELPDGSVVISSRPYPANNSKGRIFNVFKYTNAQAGQGTWGNMAYSGPANQGTATLSNSTNGELLILPAKRKSDGARTYVAFQSVPLGPNRANVAIYYKELANYAEYNNATTFSAGWDGYHQASYMPSAYSTMTLQQDGNIGFLFEEDTYGVNSAGGYNIVYKNYSIETLTNGNFLKPDFTEDQALASDFNIVKSALQADITESNSYVATGTNRYFTIADNSVILAAQATHDNTLLPEGVAAKQQALKTLFKGLENLHAGVQGNFRKPQDGDQIFIQNSAYTNLNLAVNANMTQLVGIAANDHRTVWKLEETATKGVFYIYNPYLHRYIAPVPNADETTFLVVGKKEEAGRYIFVNPAPKLAAMTQYGTSGNNTIHFKSNGNPVRWVAENSTASQFVITAAEAPFNTAWTAGLRTDLNTAANLTAAAVHKLKTDGGIIGTELGKFHADEQTITDARALVTANSEDQPAMTAAIARLVNSVGYNLPQPGFYRIKGSVSSKYIDGVQHSGEHALMNTEAGQNANGIFYLTHDRQLVNLSSGLFLSGTWGVKGLRSSANTVTFALPNNEIAKQGKYSISTGSSWLFDNGATAAKNWLDRNNSYATNNCDWVIEPVTALPVQISAVGLTTLYAPVDLQLPEGLQAYQGTINAEQTEVTLTAVENGKIPAFTPVVLQGDANALKSLQVLARTIPANEEASKTLTGTHFAGSAETKTKTGTVLTLQNIGKPGFYKYSGNTLKGFRAYIQMSATDAGTQGMSLNFGDVTAIDALNSLFNEANPAIYDLQGRRHNTLQKGINLVNGKKIIVQ